MAGERLVPDEKITSVDCPQCYFPSNLSEQFVPLIFEDMELELTTQGYNCGTCEMIFFDNEQSLVFDARVRTFHSLAQKLLEHEGKAA